MDQLRGIRTAGTSHAVAIRYLVVGGFSAALYLGLGLLLSGPVGLNIQLAIPVAYALSLLAHFSLQRYFVWAHRAEYELRMGDQGIRYALLAAAQYIVTAVATALLPGVLGVSEQVVFVVGAILAAVIVFVVLRLHVFHGA